MQIYVGSGAVNDLPTTATSSTPFHRRPRQEVCAGGAITPILYPLTVQLGEELHPPGRAAMSCVR